MTKLTWVLLIFSLGLLTYACGGGDRRVAGGARKDSGVGGSVILSQPAVAAAPAFDSTATASTNGMPPNIEIIGDDESFMEGNFEAELEADEEDFLNELDKELEGDSKTKKTK